MTQKPDVDISVFCSEFFNNLLGPKAHLLSFRSSAVVWGYDIPLAPRDVSPIFSVMPYVTLDNNLKLYYKDRESGGDTVAFLHGFTLDHRSYEMQVQYFQDSYRVIVPDARGHGKSDAPVTGYGRDDRIADIVSLMDVLELHQVHLVGSSMGGTTAIGFALKHPERLRSLTLVSSGVAGYNMGKKISMIDQVAREHGLEAAREKWKRITLSWYRSDRRRLRDFIETMMDDFSGATWMDPMRGKYPCTVDLDNVHRIRIPTLIMAGSLDTTFVELSRKLSERIKGSRLEIFEDVGHMVNLEAPDSFHRVLDEFLSGLV